MIDSATLEKWKTYQGEGMISALGEYTPPEFWELLDEYEELLNLKAAIAQEIYTALVKLGADSELLSTVGSYGDTLTDEQVLTHLKRFNEAGTIFGTRSDNGPVD